MKKLTKLTIKKAIKTLACVSAMSAGFMAVGVQAQTIYNDPLTGSGVLNGSSEPVSAATWTADTDWTRTASFTNGSSQGDNAWLPFTPTTGTSYVLSEVLTPPPNSDYNTGLGFTSSSSLNNTNTGFPGSVASVIIDVDNEVYGVTNGYDINVGGTYVLGGNNNYPSAGGTISVNGPITLTINLTAAGSGWNAFFEAIRQSTSAVLFDSGPYAVTAAEGASITGVGFHAEQNTSQVSDFLLTASGGTQSVPEPSTYTLLVAGAMMLGAYQYLRRAKV